MEGGAAWGDLRLRRCDLVAVEEQLNAGIGGGQRRRNDFNIAGAKIL